MRIVNTTQGVFFTLDDYVTVEEAVTDPRVPYTAHWLRVLAASGRVYAVKVGTMRRSPWLLHLRSLLEYIAEQRGEREDQTDRTPAD